MIIEIKIPNLPQFMSALAKAPTIVTKHINSAINKSIYEVKGRAQSVTPVGETGRLKDNWRTNFRDFFGELQPMQPYAYWVETGTDPHYIVPRTKRALFWPGAEHPVWSVKHPGTKAQPFLQTGVSSSMPVIKSIFDRALNDSLEEIAHLAK